MPWLLTLSNLISNSKLQNQHITKDSFSQLISAILKIGFFGDSTVFVELLQLKTISLKRWFLFPKNNVITMMAHRTMLQKNVRKLFFAKMRERSMAGENIHYFKKFPKRLFSLFIISFIFLFSFAFFLSSIIFFLFHHSLCFPLISF